MSTVVEQKAQFRKLARARRRQLTDRTERSEEIFRRVMADEQYRQAQRILCFVSIRDEVETRAQLQTALAAGKQVYIPQCVDRQLKLFEFRTMSELSEQTLGIPEPIAAVAADPSRYAPVESIDLAIVPGVAFGRDGTRIGNGGGYFDRLLSNARPNPFRLAIAFECQMFDTVPAINSDAIMDRIVTETACY